MRDDVKTTSELTRQSMLVVFAATIGLMTSSAPVIATTIGLFVVPMTHAFGIGRGTFNLMTGVSMLFSASLMPWVGQAIDRHGVRRLVLPGIAALAAVEILISRVPISVPLLAVLLLLQGAAASLLTPLAYTRVISLWFHSRRGQMLGMSSAIGIGAGSGICALMIGALMTAGGWRLAYLGTGLYVLVVGGLVVGLFLREPPFVAQANRAALPANLPGVSRREALGTWSFRMVMIFVVSTIGGITIMMTHGPALLAARGLAIGPQFLACAGLGSLVGQLASGFLLDRIDSPKVGIAFAVATLIGAVVVLHFGTTAAIVLPAAVVMGLGQGAETGLAPYYVSRFCGLRAYTGISGILMASVTISAGFFPAIAGIIFDRTGSYDAVMPIVDGLFSLTALSILLLPKYRYFAAPLSL
jgi:MFS family permease